MRYSDIQTVGQYIHVLSQLLSSPRGDDYSDRITELATLASSRIFQATKSQLTAAGHKTYRLNFDELTSGKDHGQMLPVILAEPGNYDLGPNIHVSRSNHLEDKFAA